MNYYVNISTERFSCYCTYIFHFFIDDSGAEFDTD